MIYTTALSIFEKHFQLSDCDPEQVSQQVYTSVDSNRTQSARVNQPASLPASQEFTHRSTACRVTRGGHFVWLIWNGQWPEGNPSLGLIILSLWWDGKLDRLRGAPRIKTATTDSIPAAHFNDSSAAPWSVSEDLKVQKSSLRRCEVQK